MPVHARGGPQEGGRRCADVDAGYGAPRGGARGEARARADGARRRAGAQVRQLARRRARFRPRLHQQLTVGVDALTWCRHSCAPACGLPSATLSQGRASVYISTGLLGSDEAGAVCPPADTT
jgi:hypothetical protein